MLKIEDPGSSFLLYLGPGPPLLLHLTRPNAEKPYAGDTVCSSLFYRAPVSRDVDCYSLTKISEILGGRQRFGLRERFDHLECGGLVQTAGTVRERVRP